MVLELSSIDLGHLSRFRLFPCRSFGRQWPAMEWPALVAALGQAARQSIRIVSIRKVSGYIVSALRRCRYMSKASTSGEQPVSNGEEAKADKDAELVAFGARLCKLREAAGMTQEALAHASVLHWTYIGQIERGERNLTYKNVLKLARGLGVEPAELMRN